MSKRWTIATEAVTATVDGTTVTDPMDGGPELAVVVTMPGFVAHGLAHGLADWSRCVEIMKGEKQRTSSPPSTPQLARRASVKRSHVRTTWSCPPTPCSSLEPQGQRTGDGAAAPSLPPLSSDQGCTALDRAHGRPERLHHLRLVVGRTRHHLLDLR